MDKLKLLDTFAGIGGFSYAAEKLVGGFKTVQFIEIDPYCQQILNKNFPNIPIHDDITTYRAEPYSADIICGGFPCTDISVAGRGEGITEATRSGLWFQLIRTIRMVRPKYFVLENVSAILNNGLDIVLRDIYEAGYDAEWCCIPSSFVGACHQRDRWWLIAYPISFRSRSQSEIQTGRDSTSSCNRSRNVANSNSMQRLDVLRQESKQRQETQQRTSDRNNKSGNVANTDNNGSSRTTESRSTQETNGRCEEREDFSIESKGSGKSQNSRDFQQFSSNSKCNRLQGEVGSRVYRPTWKTQNIRCLNPSWRQYLSQPTIRRGDDGLSNKLDASHRIKRLKALGNAIVPQVAAIPLQRVIQLEREQQ